MASDGVLIPLPIVSWTGPFETCLRDTAIDALESGRILVIPSLPFVVTAAERDLLSPAILGSKRKNISFDPRQKSVSNARLDTAGSARLAALMDRFSAGATILVRDLLQRYAEHLETGRASMRSSEIKGRQSSCRHDDRLLHVDAFPAHPVRGQRILRLFINVAPDGAAREWLIGERFERFASAFVDRVRPPIPGSAFVNDLFGLTKGRRSAYDHLMLGLHDTVKRDEAYQAECVRIPASFPPGATWICFTDQVLHAAISGHCVLEQTFHIPVEAMRRPERSPLRVLEKLVGHALI